MSSVSRVPLPGSILFFTKLDGSSLTPWTDIHHLGILLDDGVVMDLTYKGVRKIPYHRYQQQYRPQKMVCIGYVEIKDERIVREMLILCDRLWKKRDRFGYLTWKCSLDMGKLANVFVNCMTPHHPSPQRRQQNQRLFHTIQQILQGSRPNLLTVCSTFVFTILLFAIYHAYPENDLLSQIDPMRCHPQNIQRLAHRNPTWFQNHRFRRPRQQQSPQRSLSTTKTTNYLIGSLQSTQL